MANLKLQFTKQPTSKFWINVSNTFFTLAREAQKKRLPFAAIYRCETGFSYYVSTKTKHRSRLDAEADMILRGYDIVSSMVEWLERWIVIDIVSIQNLLTPFCCALGKGTLRHFPLLGGLGK